MKKKTPTIERDEWTHVKALNADAARRFLGVEDTRPVEAVPHSLDAIDGRRTWRVKNKFEE